MGLRNSPGSDRVPQEVSVRWACGRDVNYLKDIDLKSYQYPWGIEEWRKLQSDGDRRACVAVHGAEPIGFVVLLDKPEKRHHPFHDETTLEILKLGVKPASRGQGAGTQLLRFVEEAALDGGFDKVALVVPEIKCVPRHPDDVSQWLLKRGYRAEIPILKDYFKMYGQLVDGFRFTRHLKEEKSNG
jgi:GNAT superfamily N-acetyltransferase